MSARFCHECGALQEREQPRGRSLRDHNRLFALIRAAFLQWPEHHRYQPNSDKKLRLWLLVEVGCHDVEFIACPPANDDPAIEAIVKRVFMYTVEATLEALNRRRGYAVHRIMAGGVEILTPRSISWTAMRTQREYGPVREAIEALLEREVGVSAEQLLRARAA